MGGLDHTKLTARYSGTTESLLHWFPLACFQLCLKLEGEQLAMRKIVREQLSNYIYQFNSFFALELDDVLHIGI